MARVREADRVASLDEVTARRAELRALLESHGLGNLRLRDDGAIVVADVSYRRLAEAVVPAQELVGGHVRLILDSAPGSRADENLPPL